MISFLSKIIKINNLNIVGIFKKEDEEIYNVLTVKKKNNKIDVVSTSSFNTFDQFIQNIDSKLPIIIVLDGKGILNKEINFNVEADVNWHRNIDLNSIYFTSLKSVNHSFMSFCRKNIVDETVKKIQEKSITIVDVYTGSFLASLLSSSIPNDTIISNELVLEFDKNQLTSFRKEDNSLKQTYEIGKDKIASDFLPLYGVMLHFFLQQKEVTKTKNEALNIEEIIYKKLFTNAGITILVGFLIALITSYFLIQYYGSKNAEFNQQNVYFNKSYQLILDLEKQKENKLKIVKESGFLNSKFLSFYAYEIIKSIPNEIQINELNIAPVLEEIKVTKEVKLNARNIIVKGETINESAFNNWLDELKKLKWLDDFEIISLKKDKKNNSNFELKINLKNV